MVTHRTTKPMALSFFVEKRLEESLARSCKEWNITQHILAYDFFISAFSPCHGFIHGPACCNIRHTDLVVILAQNQPLKPFSFK